MSGYAAFNTSNAFNVNGRSGSMPVATPRTAGTGRTTDRVQPAYAQHHRTRFEPMRSGAPKTTMTTSGGSMSPAEVAPTGRKVIHYSLAKSEDDELQTSVNAWVPSRMRAMTTEAAQPPTDEEGKIEETRKKFMRILNKVSPENMHLMTEQIMALPIDTEQCLRKAIDILFQKAIDEPNFTPQYAHVCTEMHKKDIKCDGGTKPKLSFKKLLTICCQERLNKMCAHDEALNKTLREIDLCTDQDLKMNLQSTYNQDEVVYRQRSVGNSRFMCELYKVEMLTRHILEMSLKHLLKTPKEETLECACNILKNVGKNISHKASFGKLSEYTSPEYKSKIPTRMRFMMEEIIDLKENNWVPRASRPQQTNCKTTTTIYTKKPIPRVPLTQTVSTQKKNEPSTDIPKVSVNKTICISTAAEVKKQPTLSASVSGAMKSYASLVSPCAVQVIDTTKSYQPPDIVNIEEIQNQCESIDENICPKNLAQRMLALPIKTEECLKVIVDIIYQKAMNNPELAPAYAQICHVMKDVAVGSENTRTTFRTILNAMCQDAFESMYARKGSLAKDRQDIESCKDKETRRQLLSDFDEKELDYKRRSVANCRFIGELVKVKVLSPPILEMCAERLVETLKEINLECLYVIVKYTGNEINYSGIFDKLYEYSTSDKQKLSSRIRSVIQDTLNLKNSD